MKHQQEQFQSQWSHLSILIFIFILFFGREARTIFSISSNNKTLSSPVLCPLSLPRLGILIMAMQIYMYISITDSWLEDDDDNDLLARYLYLMLFPLPFMQSLWWWQCWWSRKAFKLAYYCHYHSTAIFFTPANTLLLLRSWFQCCKALVPKCKFFSFLLFHEGHFLLQSAHRPFSFDGGGHARRKIQFENVLKIQFSTLLGLLLYFRQHQKQARRAPNRFIEFPGALFCLHFFFLLFKSDQFSV